MKIKIQIKSVIGSVLFESEKADTIKEAVVEANLYGANLYGANLYGANLRGANLYGADTLWQFPKDFIFQCSRDILFIFQQLKSELPKFKDLLIKGKINGSQYTGTCACLCGSFANLKNQDVDQVCKDFIPFYEKGTQNMGETWFLNIKEGDTPENNEFSAHVLKLVEMVETGNYSTITYEPTKEDLEKWEKFREDIKKELKDK